MPTVASASVQPHLHAHEARGRPHGGHEPSPPFAELLDGMGESEGPASPHINSSGPKDPAAHDANTGETPDGKHCKSGKDEKCSVREARKTEKAERKEAQDFDKADCTRADGDCTNIAVTDDGMADDDAPEIAHGPVADESTSEETADKTDVPTVALAPVAPSPTPTALPAEVAVAPPRLMAPDIVAAIDNAEPVDALPPVQPLGTTPTKPPVDTAPPPAAAAAEPVDPAIGAAGQAPEPGAQPKVQASLSKGIDVEQQRHRPSESPQGLKAATIDADRAEDLGERNQGPPAEKTQAEQHRPPAHAAGEHSARQDKQEVPPPSAHPHGEPALQHGDLGQARQQDGPSFLTGQVHASSVANTHALEAPASERGIAQGIPAPPVLVPLTGLAVEIAARLQAGRNRFEIRLDPPELGRVDVRLDVDREGNVTSRLVVERTETFDLLRRDASQLERALQQAGLKTADNSLQFSLRDQPSARQHDDGPNRARVIVPDNDLAPAETGRIYGRMLGLGGGIDIRV